MCRLAVANKKCILPTIKAIKCGILIISLSSTIQAIYSYIKTLLIIAIGSRSDECVYFEHAECKES